ncbi:lytic polysaccharide monooxygenase [Hebeloma cylindrosporum]|uniref:AA9 family lytic polysaccharide monooxygenase n=1 Tax=Hebeloma cylindrosporum TaxID=76867 RepID=A0A0C3BD81_HEBCY|nr:lytic polysaccharide monooxygenase [Hebeloma cylindrosporum h7]
MTIVMVVQGVSAHYRFDTLIFGSKSSTEAVRRPAENAPIHNWNSSEITCNVNTTNATEVVSVVAGSTIGFKLDENKTIYHPGPVAIYLGKAPKKVGDWDGSGKRWFKIAEWGPTFRPFIFSSLGKSTFTAKIPADVPSGEYLVRAEQIALHIPGYPEFFVGCAQIRITGGGSANISKVAIPGYVSAKKDPGLGVDIYWPVPTKYKVPGPAVYRGNV